MLKQQGLIVVWHDRMIPAGSRWTNHIDEQLKTSQVILLLISADFINSEYCYGVELEEAMKKEARGEACVIPILVRPCEWQQAPFGSFQSLPKDGKPVTVWPNADEAWLDVAKGIRCIVEEKLSKPFIGSPLGGTEKVSRAQASSLPPIWNVPYPRNPLFTGREDLLVRLRDQLQKDQTAALSQPQAISGLGGIGKTQIALEYAYRHRGEYQATLWALADTHENLTSAYLSFASLLRLPQAQEQDSVQVIAAVKSWLQRMEGWLLVLDNADEVALAHEFLPPSFGGHVLLTTRAHIMGRFARRLEVEVLSQEQGALFLLRRAGLLTQEALLEQAEAIWKELGGLPLALDQAAAYVEETGCSLSEYQQRYQERRMTLLQRRGGVMEDHPESVATTWSISFERVKQKNLVAAALLQFCAFLAPDHIPLELLFKGVNIAIVNAKGDAKSNDWFQKRSSWPERELAQRNAADEGGKEEAIALLRAYSLIRRNVGEKTISIHRLVQAVLKESMTKPQQRMLAGLVVSVVCNEWPSNEYEAWPQCELYLPHALECAVLIEQERFVFLKAAALLNNVGYYLRVRALYKDAEPLLQRALAISERVLGPEHPHVVTALNNLALLYWDQGKYTHAASLYERALSHSLGILHPHIQQGRRNYAKLLRKMGREDEAAQQEVLLKAEEGEMSDLAREDN